MRSMKAVVVKTMMVIIACLIIVTAAGLFPMEGMASPSQEKEKPAEEQEFKNGKTVWLLMPYTGEFWWNMLVSYLEREVEADGWNFNFTTAEGSDTTQFEQVTTYAQQADILFVNPTTMTAINEAVRIAEEQYHTPVVIYKDRITGASRVCVEYSDYEAAEAMAKECVQWIEDKYGTTDGKTVIALNGDLRLSGWKMRADGFRWIKENHPEINFIEINGGMSPEGWADVAEASIGGAGKDAVALLAGSDGAYLLGALNALEKYGKLYYVGEEDHMFVASIDGKPSTLTWLRQGYIDLVYSQTPDSIAASLWDIAKEHLVDDPSYQYSPYEIPELPLPLEVEQPEGCYWGGEDLTMTVKDVPDSDTPIGKTPSPRVDRNNVNNWDLWGNSIIKLIGSDMDPVPEYDAKGTQPAWSKKLMNDFNSWK